MNYEEFIVELRRQIMEARSITQTIFSHEDQRFRKWRHDTQSIVEEALANGFRIPGQFNSKQRAYQALWSGATMEHNAKEFFRNLNDSIVELKFIVQQYQKYGAPKRSSENKSPKTTLPMPEHVTLAWLWQHVPARLWLAAVTVVVSIFLTGVFAGQSKLYQGIVGIFSASTPADSPKK